MADVSCRPANQDGCDAVSIGLTAATKGCDGGMADKLSAPEMANLRAVTNAPEHAVSRTESAGTVWVAADGEAPRRPH